MDKEKYEYFKRYMEDCGIDQEFLEGCIFLCIKDAVEKSINKDIDYDEVVSMATEILNRLKEELPNITFMD